MNKTVILGGDMRQKHLAQMFKNDGFDVVHFYCGEITVNSGIREAVKAADTVILPLPVTRDGETLNTPLHAIPIPLRGALEMCREKAVLGGSISQQTAALAKEFGIEPIDYLKREEFAVMNAIATAEGALGIAISNTDRTVFGSNCLVVGYGRIGKALSRMLRHLGANVTVSARKPQDLAWIAADGNRAIHTERISETAEEYDIIFNTVPFPVVGENVIQKCRKNVLLMELASAPGGIDTTATEEAELKYISALSLPGKTAPLSAARYIHDTILNIFRELGL